MINLLYRHNTSNTISKLCVNYLLDLSIVATTTYLNQRFELEVRLDALFNTNSRCSIELVVSFNDIAISVLT
jgi:hypothetical protein